MNLAKKIASGVATLVVVGGTAGVVDYTSLESRYDRATPLHRQVIETEELAKNKPMTCKFGNLNVVISEIKRFAETGIMVKFSANIEGEEINVGAGRHWYINASIKVPDGFETKIIDNEEIKIEKKKIDSKKALCNEVIETVRSLNK